MYDHLNCIRTLIILIIVYKVDNEFITVWWAMVTCFK